MDQRYGKDPSNRYGTGVWNGCGPGPVAGPYYLTCCPRTGTYPAAACQLLGISSRHRCHRMG